VSGVVEDPAEQFQRGLFMRTLRDDEQLDVHCLAVDHHALIDQ